MKTKMPKGYRKVKTRRDTSLADELCCCGRLKSQHTGHDNHGGCGLSGCCKFTWRCFVERELPGKLTKKRIDAYVKAAGSGCPFCGPDAQIEGEGVEIDRGGANQEVSCCDCGAVWFDMYTLTGVEVKSPPEVLP